MSKTDNLQLEIPSAADKRIFTTYKNNNEIIDEAYGQYLEDQETSQENIAMIESSTAQTNHAIGSYFMLDNVLHKATSAIASGETITSGSNATPITIEEALTALNTSVNSLRDSVSFNSVTNVRFDQLSSDRYGGIMFTGANGKYLVVFSSVGVVVMNQFGAIIHKIPWTT